MARPRDNAITPGLLAFAAGFSLIFLIGGSALLWAGHSQRRLARASLEWPWVPGEVRQFQVGRKQTKGLPPVQMRYAYSVGGRDYLGHRVLFGSHDQADIDRWAEQFPVGATPRVYFRPEQPELAVLEPGRVYGTWIITSFGAVLVIPGLLIARWTVGAARSCRPRSRRRK